METWDLSSLFALETEDTLPTMIASSHYALTAGPTTESWDLSSLFLIGTPEHAPAPSPIIFADDFGTAYLDQADLAAFPA